MRKLLRAGFFRIRKTVVFGFALLSSILLGITNGVISNCFDQELENGEVTFLLFLIMAIFVSLSNDKAAARNKVITGHTKGKIYLADTLLNIFACVIMLLIYLLLTGIICYQILLDIPIAILLESLGGLVLACVAYVTILTFISSLIRSKAVAAIVCLFLATFIFFGAYYTGFCLSQVEYGMMEYQDESGNVIEERVKNPRYVEGVKRTVFLVIHDILPQGQVDSYYLYLDKYVKYEDWSDAEIANATYAVLANKSFYPIYSVSLSALLICIGWMIVRKRDIK